jgi:hypothetical protein
MRRPPANPSLSARWMTDPRGAAGEVIVAVRGSDSMTAAAKRLGVPRRTLYRWIEVRPELVELREKFEL